MFESRAASDAVVVGGNTLRRDNPRLTTRRDSGHLPVRVVMSRTLDLPEVANLWDTQVRVLGDRGGNRGFVGGSVAAMEVQSCCGPNLFESSMQLTAPPSLCSVPCCAVLCRAVALQAAPTIVMTQRGARKHFQQALRAKGVEVVEFDFLTPEAVADYCYERGFLQVRWLTAVIRVWFARSYCDLCYWQPV